MMELDGRTVLVTGGGSGLGRALAIACASRGARVVVDYARNREGAESTVAAIHRVHGRAIAVAADVSDRESVRAMVARVEAELGAVDVLVNNAGVSRRIPFQDVDAVAEAALPLITSGAVNGQTIVIDRGEGLGIPPRPPGRRDR